MGFGFSFPWEERFHCQRPHFTPPGRRRPEGRTCCTHTSVPPVPSRGPRISYPRFNQQLPGAMRRPPVPPSPAPSSALFFAGAARRRPGALPSPHSFRRCRRRTQKPAPDTKGAVSGVAIPAAPDTRDRHGHANPPPSSTPPLRGRPPAGPARRPGARAAIPASRRDRATPPTSTPHPAGPPPFTNTTGSTAAQRGRHPPAVRYFPPAATRTPPPPPAQRPPSRPAS